MSSSIEAPLSLGPGLSQPHHNRGRVLGLLLWPRDQTTVVTVESTHRSHTNQTKHQSRWEESYAHNFLWSRRHNLQPSSSAWNYSQCPILPFNTPRPYYSRQKKAASIPTTPISTSSRQCPLPYCQHCPWVFGQTQHRSFASPPYSPDLAPCDFFLFPKMKKLLRGRRFTDEKDVRAAVDDSLRHVCKDGLDHVFEKWETRLHLSIEHEGHYFKKE